MSTQKAGERSHGEEWKPNGKSKEYQTSKSDDDRLWTEYIDTYTQIHASIIIMPVCMHRSISMHSKFKTREKRPKHFFFACFVSSVFLQIAWR